MPRRQLSVAIITYNEEENLPACLDSVRFADEVIVVDSLSTDRTPEIARERGCRIIQRSWPGHVQQKAFALEQATCEWVLSVDADERVSPELAEQIRTVLESPDRPEIGFTMPRRTWYLGRWIRHSGWYPDRKLRLVRRGRAHWGGVNPHDRMEADGPTGSLSGDLLHYSYRDIADHLDTINKFTTITAKEMLAAGRGRAAAISGMLFHPGGWFLRKYFLQLGVLDGLPGFIIACLGSYYAFLKYAKLWELKKGFAAKAQD